MSYKNVCSVDTSYFTSDFAIGGDEGTRFYFGLGESQSPKSGTVVRSLRVWVQENQQAVAGIEVELTDGSTALFGKKEGSVTDKFGLANGERIASLKMYAGRNCFDRQSCSGGFEMTTGQGRTFVVQPDNRIKEEEYEPELGSGVLVGVFGTATDDRIISLGFALLCRVTKAQLLNVQYPDLSTSAVQTSPKDIKTITYDNQCGDTQEKFTFQGKGKLTKAESWSVTTALEAGFETKVKAGYPMIVESKGKVSIEVSVPGTYERQNLSITEESFSFPLTLPARAHTQASVAYYEGMINTAYTGEVSFLLDSGKTISYPVKGVYNGISPSRVTFTVGPFLD